MYIAFELAHKSLVGQKHLSFLRVRSFLNEEALTPHITRPGCELGVLCFSLLILVDQSPSYFLTKHFPLNLMSSEYLTCYFLFFHHR